MDSSRLRDTVIGIRERCRVSVPSGVFGRYPFWSTMPATCLLRRYSSAFSSMRVRMALWCVVSKRLRILFREDFFPTAGYRHRETGAQAGVGVEGIFSSFSVSGTYGWHLYFHGAYACLNALSRTFCFPLRCVQAFTRSVAEWPSSRLRGFASGRPERWRESIPADIIGRCRLRGRMPDTWSFTVRLQLSVRVPVRSAFRCVVSKRLRILFRDGFFPSAGYLPRDTGVLTGVGSWGQCWSSSPMGSDACYLELQPPTGYLRIFSRSYAFLLRCVQAFTGSVSGRFSSRLRGFATGKRERPRTSVPIVTHGLHRLRGRLPGMRSFTVRMWFSARIAVRVVFRCVVSKRLRVLFREGFFPSAGLCLRDTGALTNVGSEGNVWSSMREGTYGFRLIFNSAFTASNGTNRSYCFPLRCVQAFADSVSGELLPVCGVPVPDIGSTGERRFRRVFLVVATFGLEFALTVLQLVPCVPQWVVPYAWFFAALCPSTCRLLFRIGLLPGCGVPSPGYGGAGECRLRRDRLDCFAFGGFWPVPRFPRFLRMLSNEWPPCE